jgi:hypothetical protein
MWWDLTSAGSETFDDSSIGEDIVCRLQDHVIPFLNRFRAPGDVLQYLGSPRANDEKSVWPQSDAVAFCYASIIASSLGRSEEKAAYLQTAIVAAHGSPIENVVLRLRERLMR